MFKKHYLYPLSFCLLSAFSVNMSAESLFFSTLEPSSTELDRLLASKRHPLLRAADFSAYADEAAQLYAAQGRQLLWLNPQKSQKNLNDALNLLAQADENGLRPDYYDLNVLKQYLQPSVVLINRGEENAAQYDLALTISVLRFLHDLHDGRVDPQTISYPASFTHKSDLNFVTLINTALEQETVDQLTAAAEPKLKQYQQLKQALIEYRQLGTEENAHTVFTVAKTLRPGEKHAQLNHLRKLLLKTGDLTQEQFEASEKHGQHYDSTLEEGVKSFQQRHGMTADGVIGKETANRFNPYDSQKITQIELALERLRWLPDNLPDPLILVNIPAFQLWAFNSLNDSQQSINMRVIVGQAEKNPTPVLFEEMKYLEFMPYWNVPRSIIEKEIIPKLLQDGNYLARQNLELVSKVKKAAPVAADADSEEGGAVEEVSYSPITELRQGRARIRQKPGSRNALGKVKFIFPNKADVYLHDTPTSHLFSRFRRDFSHGCVRVEQPERLAEFVLHNQDGWNRDTIHQAMASGSKTQRVTLKRPIPVLFLYATSFVDQNNQIQFYQDIYGQDAILAKKLQELPAPASLDNDNPLLVSQTQPLTAPVKTAGN